MSDYVHYTPITKPCFAEATVIQNSKFLTDIVPILLSTPTMHSVSEKLHYMLREVFYRALISIKQYISIVTTHSSVLCMYMGVLSSTFTILTMQ